MHAHALATRPDPHRAERTADRRHARPAASAAVAVPALAWSTPPRLVPAAWTRTQAQLAEQRACYSAPARRAMACWLQHMIALGVVKASHAARALSHREPFGALNRLYTASCTRLAERLNRLVTRHADGYGDDFRPALQIALSPGEDEEPSALLALDGYYEFPVDTLHRVPAPLATMVYEALSLAGQCFCECLMPGELWDGSFSGANEDYHDEYRALCQLGGADNLAAVNQALKENDFYHFTLDDGSIAEQLDYARTMFEGRPVWMSPVERATPLARARALRRRARRYAHTQGAHPWAHYVEYVCRQIHAHCGEDRTATRIRRCLRAALLEPQDNDVPLCFGLWVNSGSTCEHRNAESFFENMSQAGETPTERYALTRLASQRLGVMLDHLAVGIGLLMRAAAINTRLQDTTA